MDCFEIKRTLTTYRRFTIFEAYAKNLKIPVILKKCVFEEDTVAEFFIRSALKLTKEMLYAQPLISMFADVETDTGNTFIAFVWKKGKALDREVKLDREPKFPPGKAGYSKSKVIYLNSHTGECVRTAQCLTLGKTVICKEFRHKDIRKMNFTFTEALALATCSHPNICEFLDFRLFQTKNGGHCSYIVAERLKQDLAAEVRVRRFLRQPYEEAELLEILQDISAALVYTKSQNIAHRNIKPSNIVRGPEGLKLVCIGVSWLSGWFLEPSRVQGSWLYISPESGKARNQPDLPQGLFESDVFSLGMTMLHLATLKRPARTSDDSEPEALQSEVRALKYSQEFKVILAGMLSSEAFDRPQIVSIREEAIRIQAFRCTQICHRSPLEDIRKETASLRASCRIEVRNKLQLEFLQEDAFSMQAQPSAEVSHKLQLEYLRKDAINIPSQRSIETSDQPQLIKEDGIAQASGELRLRLESFDTASVQSSQDTLSSVDVLHRPQLDLLREDTVNIKLSEWTLPRAGLHRRPHLETVPENSLRTQSSQEILQSTEGRRRPQIKSMYAVSAQPLLEILPKTCHRPQPKSMGALIQPSEEALVRQQFLREDRIHDMIVVHPESLDKSLSINDTHSPEILPKIELREPLETVDAGSSETSREAVASPNGRGKEQIKSMSELSFQSSVGRESFHETKLESHGNPQLLNTVPQDESAIPESHENPPLVDAVQTPREEADLLSGRVDSNYDDQHYAQAIEVCAAAHIINSRLFPNAKKSAKNLSSWGFALQKTGNSIEALTKYAEANAIYSRFYPNDKSTAQNYFNWGVALWNTDNAAEAIKKYETAAEIYSQFFPNDKETADNLCNWGLALKKMGNSEEALAKYASADAIYSRFFLNEKATTQNLSNWGVALLGVGKSEEAVEKFAAADAIYSQYFPNEKDTAANLCSWGFALWQMGKATEALTKYSAADSIYIQFFPNDRDTAKNLSNWGLAVMEMGASEKATKVFASADAIYSQFFPTDKATADNLCNWGEALKEMKKYASAVRKFTAADAIYSQYFPNERDTADNLYNLGLVLKKTGDSSAAMQKFQAARDIYTSIREREDAFKCDRELAKLR